MRILQTLNQMFLEELILEACKLAEDEGRALRRNAVKVALAALLLAAGVVLILIGICAVFVGLFLLLRPETGSVGAAFVCASIALACGALLVFWSRRHAG